MSFWARLKNRLIARFSSRSTFLSKWLSESVSPIESSEEIPWSPAARPLHRCTVALVSTAGVYPGNERPFDMRHPDGDPSFRRIPLSFPVSRLAISHDYYDHGDADRDINVVFPIERLQEFVEEGRIGALAETHYSFMGHITGGNIAVLTSRFAPQAASEIAAQGVDAVLLTPA